MQVLETKRSEIEAKAEKMSDFLQMEYLEACLKHNIDIEARRYACMKLSELYEKKMMYPEAIKYIAKFAEVAISKREQILAYLRQAELMIKAGLYDQVDYAYKKAADLVNDREREDIRNRIIAFYKKQADYLMKTKKISAELKIYEKMIKIVSEPERIELKKKMLSLYEKLGKIKEFVELKKEMERAGISSI